MDKKNQTPAKKASAEHTEHAHTELNTLQRTVSLATGAVMLIKAIRHRSLIRGIGAGYLLYRGATGKCPASDVIGHDIMELNPIRA